MTQGHPILSFLAAVSLRFPRLVLILCHTHRLRCTILFRNFIPQRAQSPCSGIGLCSNSSASLHLHSLTIFDFPPRSRAAPPRFFQPGILNGRQSGRPDSDHARNSPRPFLIFVMLVPRFFQADNPSTGTTIESIPYKNFQSPPHRHETNPIFPTDKSKQISRWFTSRLTSESSFAPIAAIH